MQLTVISTESHQEPGGVPPVRKRCAAADWVARPEIYE
jgi:hypothetical protein